MSDERDYWCLKYYKQGMIDMYKLLKEIGAISTTQNIKEDNQTEKDSDFIDKFFNTEKEDTK